MWVSNLTSECDEKLKVLTIDSSELRRSSTKSTLLSRSSHLEMKVWALPKRFAACTCVRPALFRASTSRCVNSR